MCELMEGKIATIIFLVLILSVKATIKRNKSTTENKASNRQLLTQMLRMCDMRCMNTDFQKPNVRKITYKEPGNDFMLAEVNGMLDVAGLYVSEAKGYIDQHKLDPYQGEATSHRFFSQNQIFGFCEF